MLDLYDIGWERAADILDLFVEALGNALLDDVVFEFKVSTGADCVLIIYLSDHICEQCDIVIRDAVSLLKTFTRASVVKLGLNQKDSPVLEMF